MEGDYNLNGQDVRLCEAMRVGEDHLIDQQKEYCEIYDEGFEEDDGSTIFRPVRGRGSFRARGRPPATWVKAPPMRYRGRGGYPSAAPRGYYRRFPFESPWGQPAVMAPPYGMPPMMPMGCQLPNMSQPPPPFMPPPAAPPVNPPPPELWVETHTDTGQTYYYHAKTREAKWTRPDGAACKIVTQADIEAMVAAVRRKNAECMVEQKMEDKMELVEPLQTTIEEIKMTDLGVPPPQVASYPGWWAPASLAPPRVALAPPDHAPHPARPTGAAMGHQMCRAALGLHEPARVADTPPEHMRPHDTVSTVIPETLAVAAGAWSTHRAPDGRPYYYHAETQQSVWEKPLPLRELEGLQAKIAAAKGEKVERRNKIDVTDLKITATIDLDATEDDAIAAELSEMEREKDYKERSERLKESVRVNMGLEANTNGKQNAVSTESRKTTEEDLIGVLSDSEPESKRLATCPAKSANPNNAAQTDQSRTLAQKQTPEKAATKETEEKQKEKSEGEKTTEGQKETNKRGTLKVVSITTIKGSPWCVVWADDGRVFYYDNLVRTSVWKRPAALLNRDDVDGILANPPPGLNRRQSSEGAAAPAAKPTQAVNGEKKAETAADSEKEKEKEKDSSESSSSPAEDAEAHEARLRSFLAMLYDKQVCAFSTWENELHKIIFDARYQTLDTKERRQVFDQYVKQISENKWKDRKDRGTQRRLAFRALLEEAALQPKSTFAEFVAKYGGDDRFTEFDKPKNREGLFNEFLAEVKRREREEDRVRELLKHEFIGLLKEKGIDRHARYNDIKKKIESDARYKAVDSGAMREDYFREYCKQLKDDRKKDKDHKDHSKKERKREKKEKELLNQQKPPADDKKQPTPPPDQWAEILGIPTRGDTKQLRNRRKSPEKVPIISLDKLSKLPPKKRHLSEELKPPVIVPSPSNNKKKTSEKKKRKKTEKE